MHRNFMCVVLAIVILLSLVLSGCAQATPEPKIVEVEKIVKETVVVKETVEIEKVVEGEHPLVRKVGDSNSELTQDRVYVVAFNYLIHGHHPEWSLRFGEFNLGNVIPEENTENDVTMLCMEGPFLEKLLDRGATIKKSIVFEVPESDTPPVVLGLWYGSQGGVLEGLPRDVQDPEVTLLDILERVDQPNTSTKCGVAYLSGGLAEMFMARGAIPLGNVEGVKTPTKQVKKTEPARTPVVVEDAQGVLKITFMGNAESVFQRECENPGVTFYGDGGTLLKEQKINEKITIPRNTRWIVIHYGLAAHETLSASSNTFEVGEKDIYVELVVAEEDTPTGPVNIRFGEVVKEVVKRGKLASVVPTSTGTTTVEEPTVVPTAAITPMPIRTLHTEWPEWVDEKEEAEYMSVMSFEWLNATKEAIPVTEEASKWEEHKTVPQEACYGRLKGDVNGEPWFSRLYTLAGANVEGDIIKLNENGDTWFTVSRPKTNGNGSGSIMHPTPDVGPKPTDTPAVVHK